MDKRFVFRGGLLSALGFAFCAMAALPAAADELTLTTYYPAPFGAYDRLKLMPRDSLPAEENCAAAKDEGLMYYDNGRQEKVAGLYVCVQHGKDDFAWEFAGRPLRVDAAVPQSGRVTCLKADGTLGVCLNNPSMDGSCGCI